MVAFRLKDDFAKKNSKFSSILWGRSMCPNCNAILPWWALLPIFSYIILRGKCHNCKKHISIIYLIIEIISAIFGSLLLFNFLDNKINLFFFIIFYLTYYVLLILSIQDIKYGEISDKIAIPWIIILIISLLVYAIRYNNLPLFYTQILIALVLFTIFALIVITTNAMGGGDIRIFVILGLILPFPDILLTLTLSFVFASVAGIILAIIKKQKNIAQFHIRLIPYLAFGFSIMVIWGNMISTYIFK